ncbi:MAG: GreA/GreB family elongation factor [Tropheryma whipplei]|nr:GreA/GreB family elongation factor [Tropheryma whipplei]MCO8182506.1 GreA/GreB family elongation factor [Tropheryma whipplei]MCO8190349.1 GreA/GreB family elongation factor [Tropheryma whipplei]CAD67358.1 transcription elongation factor GreA [Tropheryma whipplei TW08/27]
MPNDSETWLSKEAHSVLVVELEELVTTGRKEIAKRIEQARSEGDLRENGGYSAAKEEQARIEGRIQQLQDLLRHARVGQAPKARGVVEPGVVVTARIGGSERRFLLGNREIAHTSSLATYSESSAIGQAILGLKEGSEIECKSPTGALIKVAILKVETYEGQ